MFRSLLITPLVLGLACLPAVPQESSAAKVRAALEQTGSIEFANVSLEQAAARLERQLGVPVAIHESLRPLLDVRRQVLSSPSGLDRAPPAPGPVEGVG